MSIPEAQLQRETLIGRGLTAEVFSWGQDRMLKLCFPWRPITDVQREFAVTRVIHAAGLPSPAAFALVVIGDRHGIVFERIRGPSLVRQVETRPWTVFAAARQLAELHAAFMPCPLLPTCRRSGRRLRPALMAPPTYRPPRKKSPAVILQGFLRRTSR